MKIICNKQSLYEALVNVSKAAADKSTISALECVKLKLFGSKMILTGYDLEIGINTVIPVNSADEGEICVNSKLFSDIVKRMPTDEIEIDIDENLTCTIIGGATEYSIKALSAAEYPAIPELGEGDEVKVSQGILKSLINGTVFAVSTNDFKPILKGELFEISDNKLNVVALDGHRLAVRTELIKTDEDRTFIVPARTLIEISRLLKDEDEAVCEIRVTKKRVVFDFSGYTVFSRLLEGEFHNYRGSIPQSSTTEVIIQKRELIDSLERAQLLINERIQGKIRCMFEDGSLKLSCQTTVGKINDVISADISGAKVEIGFNCRYLLEALKVIRDDKIKIMMNGGGLPMKIIPLNGEEYTYLVLPVRLGKSEY